MHIPPHPNSRDCVGRVGIGEYAYGADTLNVTGIFLSNENLRRGVTCPPVPLRIDKMSISVLARSNDYACNRMQQNQKVSQESGLNTSLPVPIYKPLL